MYISPMHLKELLKESLRTSKYYALTLQGSSLAEEKVRDFVAFVRTMKIILFLKPGSEV